MQLLTLELLCSLSHKAVQKCDEACLVSVPRHLNVYRHVIPHNALSPCTYTKLPLGSTHKTENSHDNTVSSPSYPKLLVKLSTSCTLADQDQHIYYRIPHVNTSAALHTLYIITVTNNYSTSNSRAHTNSITASCCFFMNGMSFSGLSSSSICTSIAMNEKDNRYRHKIQFHSKNISQYC